MRKGKIWYKHGTKVILDLVQAMLAGMLAVLIVSFPARMDGDISLREVGRGFENTKLFFSLAEKAVREKIESERDRELFETGGVYDPDRMVDIRQYQSGVLDEANYNMAVTYRIGDLLAFAGEGAGKMSAVLEEVIGENGSGEEAGAKLLARAEELETILPVSGVSLKDYANVAGNPVLGLLDLYRSLCETSLDIAARYERYGQAGEGERSAQAPSNIAYYVENTATRQYYTNLPATSQQAAAMAVGGNDDLTYLFDGERRFNIMVANPEHVMSDPAGDYFMQTSFLGNGEKVLIAADLSFPVGDEIGRAYSRYLKRAPVFYATMAGIALLAAALGVMLYVSVMVNGRRHPGDRIRLLAFEQVPTEIAAGICVVSALLWWLLMERINAGWAGSPRRYMLGVFLQAAVLYEILLLSLMSLLRRVFGGNFWENSVVYYIVVGARAVYSARKSSQRILIAFVLFMILNLAALVIGGLPGMIMALMLDLTVVLYIIRDAVGNQHIREGLKQLSTGKLDYRIDTKVLTGESRDMGRAVNEMGEGLEKAVETMLASERLKAELITNVSHDLKTPLTSIVSYVDLLKRRNLEDETAREYLEILDHKTQRLRQLTEDLVEVSKITSGNIELHPAVIELRQFIAQAGGEYEDRLAERDIPIRYELGREALHVYADGARLWRIFENLLGNVYKYGMPGKELEIRLRREASSAPEASPALQSSSAPDTAPAPEGEACILFRNVSEQKITASASALKERFGRGDESRRTEGFGLGLSIADSLASAMGGSFDVAVDETHFEAALRFPLYAASEHRGPEADEKDR